MAAFLCAVTGTTHGAIFGPGTFVETLTSDIGTWDRIDWVPGSLTDENDTSPPDGLPDSVQFTNDGLRATELYIGGILHLELDNVPTDAGVRVDANMFQGVFNSNLREWGLQTGVYFNENNWIYLARGRDAGGGWFSIRKVDGAAPDIIDHGFVGFFDGWHMQGIELTETEINFYASPAGVDTFSGGRTDFDGQMTLDLSGMTIARPASFTGDATVLVGRGYAYANGDPGDANWDFVNPKSITIAATRVTVLPEPATAMLLISGVLVGWRPRRRAA
ncbi:MAG: hypothetical protein CMJ18_15765 [Phycisphaeraceae bacterium]|nr:hypothetical protein [Phycisphaeraceae bacterium]